MVPQGGAVGSAQALRVPVKKRVRFVVGTGYLLSSTRLYGPQSILGEGSWPPGESCDWVGFSGGAHCTSFIASLFFRWGGGGLKSNRTSLRNPRESEPMGSKRRNGLGFAVGRVCRAGQGGRGHVTDLLLHTGALYSPGLAVRSGRIPGQPAQRDRTEQEWGYCKGIDREALNRQTGGEGQRDRGMVDRETVRQEGRGTGEHKEKGTQGQWDTGLAGFAGLARLGAGEGLSGQDGQGTRL